MSPEPKVFGYLFGHLYLPVMRIWAHPRGDVWDGWIEGHWIRNRTNPMVFVFLLKQTFMRSAALVIMGSNATLIADS